MRSPKSANSISASLLFLVRVPAPFSTYILPRLVRIRLVRVPFFWNALLALTEELLYSDFLIGKESTPDQILKIDHFRILNLKGIC